MKVIITRHAEKRLRELRQQDIVAGDIIKAATGIPGFISAATRFRGFLSNSGKFFDIVVKDLPGRRLVITIIGKSEIKNRA